MEVSTKIITLQEVYSVRQPVLTKDKPLPDCQFNGDTTETTFHIGSFIDNKLVAVGTLMKNGHSGHNLINAYQLRGMAVLNEYQSKGIGKVLLKHGEIVLREKRCDVLWMNARKKAVRFYEKSGYSSIGAAFDIPLTGTHCVMYKNLKY